MSHGVLIPPQPRNEPILNYAPGSPERAQLKAELKAQFSRGIEYGSLVGDGEVKNGRLREIVCPHDHKHTLGKFHEGGADETRKAIDAALAAWPTWARAPWETRAAVFLKAADLLATKYRAVLNAATMHNQSKTPYQAEIDAACELIDFWRFNVYFMRRMLEDQPYSPPGQWNVVEFRPLEGFVFAVTPFNFTSIAANLPTAPALMGCTVVWKPSPNAMLAPYFIMQLLRDAGLPPGVINLVAGGGAEVGDVALQHPDLAGIHFTGSTATFQHFVRSAGQNIAKYKAYPRLVGETGGKDFIVAHASADPEALAVAILRGAFEFQGQKCSAASRLYIPDNLWPDVRDRVAAGIKAIKVGDPTDFTTFMGAVIDRRAYDRIKGYVDFARAAPDHTIVAGGECDDTKGFFVHPTLVQANDPKSKLMREEIFGPVVTAYVYPAAQFGATLDLCNTTSPYALTGAIFARERAAIDEARRVLWHAAGNFYINDKPTGAVVGQQPFGGGRASGTNDKAGAMQNLLRWVSTRTIKETFVPPAEWRYPHMAEP